MSTQVSEGRRIGTVAVVVGLVILVLQWVAVFGFRIVAPATFLQFMGMLWGPPVGLLLLLVWWLKVVPNRWPDRLLGFFLPFLGFFAAMALAHPSAKMVVYIDGVALFCLVFFLVVLLTSAWNAGRRRLALVATAVVAFGIFTLVRTTGVDGDMSSDFAPRWAPTAEERFLETAAQAETVEPAGEMATPETAAWPGLRGAHRDAVVTGVRVATDWTATPPQVLWRHAVGPGWSSFAVAGDRLFTQEQRGDDEVVVCYLATTGEPVWVHADQARFWETMAGAGPRATPTFADGRVYTLGATGLVDALDAADGSLLWQRNLVDDTGAPLPEWGFSASPLVVDGLVVVYGGAPDGKGTVAYDAETGEPRWFAPSGPASYSSVQEATLAGERQLLIVAADGLTSLAPVDGTVLWHHEWPIPEGSRVVQPAVVGGSDVLVGTSFGIGTRRVTVAHADGAWTTAERWTSVNFNPYYNDLVVHGSHAYGFDGRILACLDLESGERLWKGGRYGNGQLLLLADQDLLLVVSDRGEIALVKADPSGYAEVAKFQAIEGKTWNHPALADGVLYVRNGEEMAALRLPV